MQHDLTTLRFAIGHHVADGVAVGTGDDDQVARLVGRQHADAVGDDGGETAGREAGGDEHHRAEQQGTDEASDDAHRSADQLSTRNNTASTSVDNVFAPVGVHVENSEALMTVHE